MNAEYDYMFRILPIGNRRVGKTSIQYWFVDDEFYDFVLFPGVDFKFRTIGADGKTIKL